ncbi:hypothetical protein WICPIJ_004639 [Wickerhamomyces pijperi]|uniref:Pheromone a factor receptor n=1 Tax=Wickerhamomyces pijperi TaxID=599730 RepID=A0A9P8Q784_WICPI|nr:hypothetical protein WICPIJ_004639 [Wickerhamomyces pijperi]
MGFQAALVTLSTFAILTIIPPLFWHIKTFNISAICLVLWLLIMDCKIFVDAIIWGVEDFKTRYNGRGYCDVMVKFQVGFNVGVLSSLAGIMINLYVILKADRPIPSNFSKKKIITDLLINLSTPVFCMATNYLVQSSRYYVFQYTGCQSVNALNWVTIVTYTMWLLIWSLVNVVLAGLIIFSYFKRRKDVKDILKCTNSGLNLSRFAKLLTFCCVVILVMFPFSLQIFFSDITKVSSTYNFSKIHNEVLWGKVFYYQTEKPYYIVWVYLTISFCTFFFFGLGSDAMELYLDILSRIGFGPIVRHIKNRRLQKKMQKADKLVNSVITSQGPGGISAFTPQSAGSGTVFDIEMQRIKDLVDTNENGNGNSSPTNPYGSMVAKTSTSAQDQHTVAGSQVSPQSNLFHDKYQVPAGQDIYNYLSDFDENLLAELDDEDLAYLNQLDNNNQPTTPVTDGNATNAVVRNEIKRPSVSSMIFVGSEGKKERNSVSTESFGFENSQLNSQGHLGSEMSLVGGSTALNAQEGAISGDIEKYDYQNQKLHQK